MEKGMQPSGMNGSAQRENNWEVPKWITKKFTNPG